MVARGLVRHCPRCGGGHLFAGWVRLKPRCPTCGLHFEREEGFWLGAYVINMALGESGLVVFFIVLIAVAFNGGRIDPLPFGTAAVLICVGGPLLTYPISRTAWSAIDLIMRPLEPAEIQDAQAAVARSAVDDAPPRS
jgi:hypothetical protein